MRLNILEIRASKLQIQNDTLGRVPIGLKQGKLNSKSGRISNVGTEENLSCFVHKETNCMLFVNKLDFKGPAAV